MQREMVNFEDDTGEWIEEQVEAGVAKSKSELIKQLFHKGRELDEELAAIRQENEELRRRLEDKEERIESLEEQLAKRSQLEEKIEDLPDRIRGEETYQERRQRLLDQASPMQRIKWRVTGVPVNELDEE